MWRDGKITSSDPNTMVGNFHWPFLANAELATELITAMGGGLWTEKMMERWMGKNEDGIAKLRADEGMEVYVAAGAKESVIRASCEDYKAGATVDMQREIEDLELKRLIPVPVLAVHSAGLGRTWDVKTAWEGRVKDLKMLKVVEVGGGIGHFVAEEAPEETWDTIGRWFDDLGLEV